MHSSFEELYHRVEANCGLIFIDTFEEQRLIRELKARFKDDIINFWSATQGLHEIKKDEGPEDIKIHHKEPSKAKTTPTGQPSNGNILSALDIIEDESRKKIDQQINPGTKTLYVLRDPDKFFNNPMPVRKLRDISYLASTAGSSIICTGPGIKVPTELEKDSAYIELGLPTKDEIKNDILKNRICSLIDIHNEEIDSGEMKGEKIDTDFDLDVVSRACSGLTEDEIINTAGYSLVKQKTLDVPTMLEEKRNIINKNDILTYWACDDNMDGVGGFKNLKEWWEVQKAVMDNPEAAKQFNAEQPKGIMILGVQGSGKTHIAKALAKEMGQGAIKLDMGRVFAGLVGESEKRMRMALAQAEAAGGVIIIDELDKGLAGAGGSDKTDGGTTKRVIGTLLTWMNDPHPGLFIVATANDITAIRNAHPELLRKGRFDEIWFSDIPSEEERKAIFQIHLEKRNRKTDKIDLDELAKTKYIDESGKEFDYTGAEIEYSIKEAISHKLAQNILSKKKLTMNGVNDIKTADIKEQLLKIKPIVKVGEKAVKSMRTWAGDNARNVSVNIVKDNKTTTKGSKSLKKVNTANINLR